MFMQFRLFLGYYNNGSAGTEYLADISDDNTTCIAEGFTRANAADWFTELSDEYGYDAHGKCLIGRYIDQKTGDVLSGNWYDYMYYDPRIRPWYRAAVEAGKRSWSPIYVFSNPGHPVGITAARPVYNANDGSLIGVAGLDFVLTAIEEIIKKFQVYDGVVAFLLDGLGPMMVGASVSGISTSDTGYGGSVGQTNATIADNAVVQLATKYVMSLDDQADETVHIVDNAYWVQQVSLSYFACIRGVFCVFSV